MTRALVIGGSGFIGLNVVDALLLAGHEVRVTRRKSTSTIQLRKRPVELVEGSLQDPEALRRAMDGCDVVLVTGAYYPRYSLDRDGSIEDGVSGLRNACEAALAVGVRRFVYTSSVASLAVAKPGPATEDDVPVEMPESVYRAVKWAMEREVEAASARGLSVVTLLPGGCVGPWDFRLGSTGVIVGVIRSMLPWRIDGTVNMVDVGDVARAHVAAMGETRHHRYCLSGHDVDVGEYLARVASRYGGTVPQTVLSLEEAGARADADEADALSRKGRVAIPREFVDIVSAGQRVSSARATADLGVTFTPLDVALDQSYAWLKRYGYVPRNQSRPTETEIESPLS